MDSKIVITGGSGFVGTNMMQYYIDKNSEVINIDIKEPRNAKHLRYWKKVDILDLEALKTCFKVSLPTHVVHLAARTDLKGKYLTDYSSNITATNPTTFDIHFQALNSTMENAHFKNIELFYYT